MRYQVWGNWHEDSAHDADDNLLHETDSLEEANRECADYNKPGVRSARILDTVTGENVSV